MGEASQTLTPDTRFFRDVFNASPIGIAVENLEGQPLFVNPALCSMLGFSEAEMCGKHCVQFSPPEDSQKDWALFQQLRDGSIDHYQLEKRYFRRDGSLVWGRLNMSVLNSRSSPLFVAMVEDITDKKKAQHDLELERKRSEEALREREERLRLAAQAGRMFAYSWDAVTDAVERSGEAAEILGVEEGKVATGAALSAMVHPDDKERLEAAVAKFTVEQPTLQISYRMLRPNGEIIWLERNSRAYFDEHGKLKRIVGMIVDVTERKRAEAALCASEERLRLAQQAARMGTFEWNIRTGVNTWMPELESMYGLPAGGFGGTQADFVRLIHPDDRPSVENLVDLSLRTGQPTMGEWRVVWPDESVHWIAGRWQVFTNDSSEPLRMVGVNIDITERKMAEDKLREYERTVEGSEDMIVVVDRGYRYLIANRQFLKMRNLTREQVVGRSVREVLNAEVFETVVRPKLDECFQGKVVRYEMKYTFPELGERDLLVSYFPIEDATVVSRVACILQDVTDRKQADAVLADMSRKLIEAQEQERVRIGRELHDDINQRLAMLAIELEQLQGNPSQVEQRVAEIRKGVAEISNDVQALSHDLHSSKLEYLGVVAGIRSWCKEFAERQRIEIDFRSDVSSVLPFEVGLSLFRVLQEALHNAIKHSGVGRVEVQLREAAGEIHLVVRDSGRGFDLEPALQGKGLGLTSMRERVRLVNGTIAIESKPMGGTSIHVGVPLPSDYGSRRAAG
jgi:PAS domain S-box-containing protein